METKPTFTRVLTLSGIQAISELVNIVAKETGAIEMTDADEDSVGWNDAGPLPMTFGHVRRAVSAVCALAAKGSPVSISSVFEAAEFLCRRLEEFESELEDNEAGRQYYGHVHPAFSRLVGALDEMDDNE